jgi:2-dehydro-3-deoxyphosphogluconate aldolase/(4S)-4-hydroxy-2-oxoglutarate aldolase
VNRAGIASAIMEARVMAVIRLSASSLVREVVHALVDGGMRVIEITMTTPDALREIERLAASLPESIVLGAGTVIDGATAIAAIDAGARFVVSPVCRPALIEACHQRRVVMMPGGLTPTEILTAHEAGADFVKVFPASAVGPAFVRDVKGPLPDVRLVPTGGIGIEQAAEWLRAGASAVGVGGSLIDRRAVAAGDCRAVTAAATRLVASVRELHVSPGQVRVGE